VTTLSIRSKVADFVSGVDTPMRSISYVDLNSRAQLLRYEFEVMYNKLRTMTKVDVRASDEVPDATTTGRDDLLVRMKTLKAALALARETIRAEDAAFVTVFSNRQLAIRRSEAIESWKPIILQLAEDINACAMLMPWNSYRWFRDPLGAHDERYRGKTDWTDRVRDCGVESIDAQ
jgi:hypothetical protein